MLKLFSGTANPALSQEVADILGLPLSQAEVVRFDNSEVRVRIEEDVKDTTCVVIQPTSNPTDNNLIELFLTCDALRRQEARKVIGIIPYFGYARQDIQHRPGECISANMIIRVLESIGFQKIYTFDLHAEATEGVFTIPFKNMSALTMLADRVKEYLQGAVSKDEVAIVSPDQGGIERARKFGTEFFGDENYDAVVAEKRRDQAHKHVSKAVGLYGDVEGKTAILVDDMTTSAGTIVHAAELCIEHGANKVLATIVHHDFSIKAPERLQNSSLERVFTTNTIALKEEFKFPKLEEISVAPLIAEELKRFVK